MPGYSHCGPSVHPVLSPLPLRPLGPAMSSRGRSDVPLGLSRRAMMSVRFGKKERGRLQSVPAGWEETMLTDEQVAILCDIGQSIAFSDDKNGEVEHLIIEGYVV